MHTDWAHPALVLAAGDVVDTDTIEDEVATFDRAIEKGIGRIRLELSPRHHRADPGHLRDPDHRDREGPAGVANVH